jgi:hypothetical protein
MVKEIELIRDFIDLHKLPLQAIKNIEYFEYALGEYGILEEWKKFIKKVDERFGSKEEYRKYYWETKESFLKYVKNLPEFQAFNTQDMSKFKFDFPKDVTKGDPYKDTNAGKTLLSIDLKKANWQALKYCGVFKDIENYEDLIERFTDIDFIKKSKYLRSVVFGQLNPSRHTTVESYLVNLIRPEISDRLKLICMAQDELVYEVPTDIILLKSDLEGTEREIKEKYGLNVTAEYYKLNQTILEANISKKQYKIYSKQSLCGEGTEYKCIPNNLWLIFRKLSTGRELCEYDLWLEHDGVLSKYIENFKLL